MLLSFSFSSEQNEVIWSILVLSGVGLLWYSRHTHFLVMVLEWVCVSVAGWRRTCEVRVRAIGVVRWGYLAPSVLSQIRRSVKLDTPCETLILALLEEFDLFSVVPVVRSRASSSCACWLAPRYRRTAGAARLVMILRVPNGAPFCFLVRRDPLQLLFVVRVNLCVDDVPRSLPENYQHFLHIVILTDLSYLSVPLSLARYHNSSGVLGMDEEFKPNGCGNGTVFIECRQGCCL